MSRAIGRPGSWAYEHLEHYTDRETGEPILTVIRTDHGEGDNDYRLVLPDGTTKHVKCRCE